MMDESSALSKSPPAGVAGGRTVAGIVLCGGRSSRMGTPKLSLRIGAETFLERIVGTVSKVCSPVVVVAGPEQSLPKLPSSIRIVRDEREHLGPLAALGLGLAAVREASPIAFVCGCDSPLLSPDVIRLLVEEWTGEEFLIPRDDHPALLTALYATTLADAIGEWITGGERRLRILPERCTGRFLSTDRLRSADPELWSLRNTNTPEEYEAMAMLKPFANHDSRENR